MSTARCLTTGPKDKPFTAFCARIGLAALVKPVLDIMDRLYSARMVLEGLARQHGDAPNRWPPAVAQQLRQRHNALARAIEKHICSLSDDCYPIGVIAVHCLLSWDHKKGALLEYHGHFWQLPNLAILW
jgi:hypothetical protein